jgi:hypothetical protein
LDFPGIDQEIKSFWEALWKIRPKSQGRSFKDAGHVGDSVQILIKTIAAQ